MKSVLFSIGLTGYLYSLTISFLFTSKNKFFFINSFNIEELIIYLFLFFFILNILYYFFKKKNLLNIYKFFFYVITLFYLFLLIINSLEGFIQPYSNFFYFLYIGGCILFLIFVIFIYFFQSKFNFEPLIYSGIFFCFSMFYFIYIETKKAQKFDFHNNINNEANNITVKYPNIFYLVVDSFIHEAFFLKNYKLNKDDYPTIYNFAQQSSVFYNHSSTSDLTLQNIKDILSSKPYDSSNIDNFLKHLNEIYKINIIGDMEFCELLYKEVNFSFNCANEITYLENNKKKFISLMINKSINTLIPEIPKNYLNYFYNTKSEDNNINNLNILLETFQNSHSFNNFYFYFIPTQTLNDIEVKFNKLWHPDLIDYNEYLEIFKKDKIDSFFIKIFDAIKEKKSYDNSIILISSDHSLRFSNSKEKDDYKLLNDKNTNIILNKKETLVPLLIKANNQNIRKDIFYNTNHFDISSTIKSILEKNNINFKYKSVGTNAIILKSNRFLNYNQIHFDKKSYCIDTYNNMMFQIEFNKNNNSIECLKSAE